MKSLYILFSFGLSLQFLYAQSIPSTVENIDYIVTFGNKAQTSWGDDDFSQTFFILIPKEYTKPFYIRLYDPECGGELDEANGAFNTTTTFEVFGGHGAFTNPDAQAINPQGNYKSGIKIASKSFGSKTTTDKKWSTLGPFNPTAGELVPKFNGRVFKIIIEGKDGDDGNLYKLFISTKSNKNVAIEGGNAFTYECSFRLKSDPKEVTHLYPFIEKDVVALKQYNFDFDNDGQILLYSVTKNRHSAKVSGNNNWGYSKHNVSKAEKNTTVDLQIIKKGHSNNDVVVYVKNQYDKAVPFFTVPIGGPPKYKFTPIIKYGK